MSRRVPYRHPSEFVLPAIGLAVAVLAVIAALIH